ncbi:MULTISPECIES: hypothetical protein [Actinomadura]|uniref:Uncharacterized protein n=1 Tax=Actinomadura madurae TaxID=1993 RepID=A0A1I4WUM8_9ACTN|nr:hypothetical protein [Actinomadura madurae]MCP9954762.1 hypothetical protein [Actinomadura madurae]MCP9971507.1 hypothetical protein [Actinomadura madurae]MCP9983996.1 hypothetical protein [Actinomadura madurae]MCQ0004439.1 hypothetical protein [Actinomadura madurae]MCQ0020225.1 hypothetical protein [Actinomadura madurae]
MREIRSADPWSAFLAPSGRDAGRRTPGAAPAGEPGHTPSHAEPGAEDACRRVLAQLRSTGGPLSLEQIHHATRLGLMEVAEAVDMLRERGLVAVEREIDEVVRLTGE